MLPAKPFYLIRHGETDHNVLRVLAGGLLESELTEAGRDQARALAPFLPDLEIRPGALHHSTMKRAHETADILNAHMGLPMTANYDLREHEMGEWDGQPYDVVLPKLERLESPPGGESHSAFSQHMQSTLTDILVMKNDLPLIVAHGGFFHGLGYLYEYAINGSQNCHLHYFEPEENHTLFPWRVWQFDIEKDRLVKRPAPFCLSQALSRMT